MTPFIVFSLPRSRSAWVSRFLSYGARRCGHDLATECATVRELADRLCADYCGTAETGAVIGWRAIRRLLPDVRFVVIRRPVAEVHKSLSRFSLGAPEVLDELKERDALLDQLARQEGVRSFAFASLGNVGACQELFEFCLGIPFDWEWWESLANINVQVDVAARIKYLIDNRERIDALKADARRILEDDVMIGPEPWDSLWPEVDPLFAEHFAEVGGTFVKHRPYCLDAQSMRAMHAMGSLRIWTARVGGELAGYCMWTVTSDVESAGLLIALHGPWYVRAKFARHHLGRKLFDASIEGLRKAGVQCAFPHHPLDGRGARLRTFFKRRGAIETQRTYSLWLGKETHA